MKSRVHLASSLIVLTLALSGCVAQRHAVHMVKDASQASIDATQDMPKADPARGNPDIAHVDDFYFGQSTFKRRRGDELPARLDRVMVRGDGDVDVRGFAALVTKATNLPVALNIDRPKTQNGDSGNASGPLQVNGMPRAGSAANRLVGPTMRVLWDGSLAGLLDMGAAKFGVDWEYRNGVIQISDERTETFIINKLATTTSYNNQLTTTAGSTNGSSSSSGSTAASGTISPTSTFESAEKANIDVWTDIKNAVGVIIGERGRYAVSPANGTLTVTASPAVIDQVASYVRTQNNLMTRQVFVRVRVYSVDLQESDNTSLSFNLALSKVLGGSTSITGTSPGTDSTTAAGSLTATVVSGTSKLSGSEIVAKALSGITNTAEIADLNVTALNNTPVTKQDIVNETYLSSTSTTATENSTTNELTPGTISTGFTMTLLPRILSNNRILLGYSIDLSSLVSMTTVSSGDSTIQLPTVAASNGIQNAMLQSGQALMLMGYVSNTASDARQGTGLASNLLLGGTRAASTEKKRVIITIEPVIISENEA